MRSTLRISAMVLFILICSQVFSLAFRGLQGDKLIEDLFRLLPGGVGAQIWFLMALIFVLGFFIEWIEISYIAVPLFLPIFVAAGVDLVWLAMLITVNLQSSFLTPPFGWALFFLRGVAPPRDHDAAHLQGRGSVRAAADPRHRARLHVPGDRDLAAEGDRLVGAAARSARRRRPASVTTTTAALPAGWRCSR